MAVTSVVSGSSVETSGSPYGVVLRLALPTVLAMLTQSIVNEIDIVFFSYLPCPESSNAQAALFPSLVLLWMFGGSLSAISVGTQTIAARRIAQQKTDDAGAVLTNSWVFGAVSAVLFTVIGYLALPYILRAQISVPAVRDAASSYLKWRLLGITSMVLTFSFKSFFDAIGRTYVHMVGAIVMNAANVLLCIVFIFGRWGAPRMGIAGAGLAGFVSTWIGLAIMVGWAVAPRYRRQFRPFNLRRVSASLTRDILRLSIPSAVATVAVMSGFFLFSKIVSHLDSISGAQVVSKGCGESEAVNSAATAVIVGILKLTFTACLGFGTSTATLVSQSLGRGDGEKAERFGWVSVRLGLLIFGIVGLLEGVVFTREILGFVTHSPAVLEAAVLPMRVMGICTPLIAVAMILTQALFGAGNTRFVMVVELLLHFLCLVPLAWLLGITFNFGLIGIWAAAVTYVVALMIVMVVKFRSGDWKAIAI